MTIHRKQLLFLLALTGTVGAVTKSFKVVLGPDGVTPLCASNPPSAVIPWSNAAVGFSASVPAAVVCGHSCTGYVGCISFNYRESQSTPATCEMYTSVPRNCTTVMTSSEHCQHYELSDSKRSCLPPPANLALNLAAYQQSTYFDASAALAIDGKYDTNSCTTINYINPWWAVDLGHAYKVQEVVVVNDANVNTGHRLNYFVVRLSNQQPVPGEPSYNITEWTLCAQYQGTVAVWGIASVVCSTDAGSFRYVAVVGSLTSQDAICLTEVLVFFEQNSTGPETTSSNRESTAHPVTARSSNV